MSLKFRYTFLQIYLKFHLNSAQFPLKFVKFRSNGAQIAQILLTFRKDFAQISLRFSQILLKLRSILLWWKY